MRFGDVGDWFLRLSYRRPSVTLPEWWRPPPPLLQQVRDLSIIGGFWVVESGPEGVDNVTSGLRRWRWSYDGLIGMSEHGHGHCGQTMGWGHDDDDDSSSNDEQCR